MARSEGMGWGGKMAIGAGVLLVLAAVGLAIYGGSVHPKQHEIQQVVPNDRFSS
ncbi:MAG: hypothetical protein KJS68_09640 [Alphaproteobacteria bacterium]|nr:hypothetical protein [Alphaproteobacteria bacterium]